MVKIKMSEIEKVANETKDTNFRDGHLQVSLVKNTGELLTNYHVGESWTEYHDSDIVYVLCIRERLTAETLRSILDYELRPVLDEPFEIVD